MAFFVEQGFCGLQDNNYKLAPSTHDCRHVVLITMWVLLAAVFPEFVISRVVHFGWLKNDF